MNGKKKFLPSSFKQSSFELRGKINFFPLVTSQPVVDVSKINKKTRYSTQCFKNKGHENIWQNVWPLIGFHGEKHPTIKEKKN